MNAGFPIYRLQCTLENHKKGVVHVKFSPCGQSIASCCHDDTIKIWDAAGKLKSVIVDPEESRYGICGVDWSNDGRLIASAYEWLQIWNINTGEYVKFPRIGPLFRVNFSPDASLIATGSNFRREVNIWDVESQVRLNSFEHHGLHLSTSVHFDNQTSRLLTSNTAGFCNVYDLRSMDVVQSIHGETMFAFARFSPDSRNILFGTTDNTISLFDLRKNEVARTYQGHRNVRSYITATFSSTSGKYIISGSEDSLIYIWDINTQELVEVLGGHSDEVMGVCYHPEEDIIVSGDTDGIIKIWKSA